MDTDGHRLGYMVVTTDMDMAVITIHGGTDGIAPGMVVAIMAMQAFMVMVMDMAVITILFTRLIITTEAFMGTTTVTIEVEEDITTGMLSLQIP